MIISYKWLKEYLSTDLDINQISNILTDIGLEVENIKYFDNLMDWSIDIVITPNRSDAISHYGIARDLYAALITREYKAKLKKPSVKNFKKDMDWIPFSINIENTKKCLRYSGITISNIKINPSPKWLQDRLKVIKINPINNVIDIINFVMFEFGQPMHVFDADKILLDDKKFNIKVKTINNTTLLDNINLSSEDLIICNNQNNPICIAGILEGINYRVTNNTKNIFIDSAYFSTLTIRKSVKRHNLNTEYSFRFERGIDPNQTIYALKRAALLIKEITCGYISSDIIDIYPVHISNYRIILRYNKIYNIIGCKISKNKILQILELLEIKVISKNEYSLILSVPLYRVDVQREIDIIEEILRIYGYNNIKSNKINSSYELNSKYESKYELSYKIEETIAKQLLVHGFNEIITISLKKHDYINLLKNDKMIINVMNPLSNDLSVMQPNLLFGMLESISYNIKRKNLNLKLFEFGKIYINRNNNLLERKYLSLIVTGKIENIKWIEYFDISFFYLKGIIEQIMQKIGIDNYTQKLIFNDHFLYETLIIKYLDYNLFKLGKVRETITKKFDITQNVFYAEFNLEIFNDFFNKKNNNIHYINISKYPGIKRDLALLLDNNILFEDIYYLAKITEKNLLKKVKLFDIYQGNQLPIGKKSYAISFYFENKKQTLTNQIIDKIMNKLKQVFKEKLGAEIRK